jgi:hypothetical protein
MNHSDTDTLSTQRAAEVGTGDHSREETIQFAKTAFVVSKLYRKRSRAGTIVEVLFDSSLQPIRDGVRSAGKQTRQMLFRAGPYQVDVQIEAIPDAPRLAIIGQLLNASDPQMIAREAHVTLSNRRGNLVHLITNEYGEFRGEVEDSGDLELVLRNGGGKPIIISLRKALG